MRMSEKNGEPMLEKSLFFMGKSTISMVIFHSFLYVYQAGYLLTQFNGCDFSRGHPLAKISISFMFGYAYNHRTMSFATVSLDYQVPHIGMSQNLVALLSSQQNSWDFMDVHPPKNAVDIFTHVLHGAGICTPTFAQNHPVM